MTHLVLIDAAEIEAIKMRLDALTDALRGATVIPAPEWVTVAEAAKRMGCSEDTIRRRIASGALEAKGSGKLRRVRV